MSNESIKCPTCGSANSWINSQNSAMRLCQNCGNQYFNTTLLDHQPQPITVEFPDKPDSEILEKPNQPSGDIGCVGILIIALGTLVGVVIVIGIVDFPSHDTNIDPIGQYVVEDTVECDESPLVIQYGLKFGEPPTWGGIDVRVYPGTNDDHWVIDETTQSAIEASRGREYESDYLWVHCEDEDNEPGYFIRSFYAPENGRRVIFGK